MIKLHNQRNINLKFNKVFKICCKQILNSGASAVERQNDISLIKITITGLLKNLVYILKKKKIML